MQPVNTEQFSNPRVSVGIPLYRSARFLDIIIANIDAMPKDEIEILISDHHCYDDAIDVLMNRYADDPRIRFFKHRDELDWVGNINSLLQDARGEYWRFLPHDDTSPKGSLEALIRALDINPDAVLAYGPSKAIDLYEKDLAENNHWRPQPKDAESNSILGVALEMCWNWHFYVGSFKGLIRRKVLVENNLLVRGTYRQVIPERCWQFALCLLGRFVFVPEALYIKRFYPESISRQWKFFNYTYYSAAWTMSTYIWDLLGPLSVRIYSIFDVWINAHRLARWRNDPQHVAYPAYYPVPDILAWFINKFVPNKLSRVHKLGVERQQRIDAIRMMVLPNR